MDRLVGGEESRQYERDCPYPEALPCGRGALLLFWRVVLPLKFQAVHSRSLVNHVAGHLPGFKTEGAASFRELIVPGDEKMFAVKTISLLFFQMAKTCLMMGSIYEKGSGIARDIDLY